MTELSAVILAKTDTQANFDMTMNCIRTLKESESAAQVILVESFYPPDPNWTYPDFVEVIYPQQSFNFHKFLNIGIAQSTGKFVAMLNNDLLFDRNWFDEIRKFAGANPQVRSFSPNPYPQNGKKSGFELGYKVRTHIAGWCIVCYRSVFHKIGKLDETFDFYYADNDYAMTLKKFNIRHAVVFGSTVIHLENVDKGEWYKIQQQLAQAESGKLPKYLDSPQYDGLRNDPKSIRDNLKYHKKWGHPVKLYRKNKIADVLIKYHLGILNRIVMSV